MSTEGTRNSLSTIASSNGFIPSTGPVALPALGCRFGSPPPPPARPASKQNLFGPAPSRLSPARWLVPERSAFEPGADDPECHRGRYREHFEPSITGRVVRLPCPSKWIDQFCLHR